MTDGLAGYTELRELGAGAGGRVMAARHDETGIPVAIKYLSAELRNDPEFVRAYRAEARIMCDLDDAHIARLYEYIEDDSQTAIVMQLVDGVSLAALLAESEPLIPEAALLVMLGSLSALASAHRLGVVHRDYKPANVMITQDGDSVLLDFGIAARSGAAGMTSGSPSYMAPEQWRGEPCSPAGDVYAVTATFVECITGHPPFVAADLHALALQHQSAPIPLSQIPEPVRELARSGLAKDPGARPSTADEFIAALMAAASAGYGADWADRGKRHLAARVAALLLLLPFGAPELASSDLAVTRFGRRLAVAAGAAVLALVVGSGAAAVTPVWHRHSPRHVASPTRPGPADNPSGATGSGPTLTSTVSHAPRTSTVTPTSTSTSTTPGGAAPGTDGPTSGTSVRTAPHIPAPRPPRLSHSATTPPPTVVQKLEVTSFAWGNKGSGPSASASFYVATSGPGVVHLGIEYHTSGGFERSVGPITLSGATTYYPSDTEDFTGVCGIIEVTIKTDAGGFAAADLPTAQC